MKASRLVAAIGLALALAADAFLLLVSTYHGSACTTSPDGAYACHDTSATLIEENGHGALVWLVLPTMLAAILLATSFSGFKRRRLIAWVVVTVFVAFCLATGFSIGIAYLPAALFCVIAATAFEPVGAKTNG